MDKIIAVQAPLTDEMVKSLKAGDMVRISGTIYTGRDAAHKRLIDIIRNGGTLPFPVRNQIIYYVGPCPAKPGQVIGSAGPTTSGRMDVYAPDLIRLGLKGMIGKGQRDGNVKKAMIEEGAVYFGAIGGAAALIANSIIKQEVIAFEDLGTEAVHKLEVKDFPAVVVIDSKGIDLYELGRKEWGGE